MMRGRLAEERSRNLLLGIDVGGTFTDLALLNCTTGILATDKVPTTRDPSEGALYGLRRLKAAGWDLSAVKRVLHATTLVSNALIERRGAKTGLLTTMGFRDVLYFGREYRYDIYDPKIELPKPLIPQQLRVEVRERTRADGTILAELDEREAREAVRYLIAQGVDSIAVVLLHSYRNSTHELRLRALIQQESAEIAVSLSHEVLPQIREYERTCATAINAYVQPLIRPYLDRLQRGISGEGIGGEVYLMASGGGIVTAGTAAAFPIHLVDSGPSAGALMATQIGARMESENVVSFDMGGTTSKTCVIKNGQPSITRDYEVGRVRRFRRGSGLPVGVSVIDMLEIGAGGGSIAEIDELGLLRVGPRSAGANPGPACYARGGEEPTVTDANVVLGLINTNYFVGGEMELDGGRAASVIEDRIGRPLGLRGRESAAAIHRLVTENMAEATRVHSLERNIDLRRFTLVAFGGAGPIHAYGIARRLKMPRIVCPPNVGVLSAVGLLVAPLRVEVARSHPENVLSLNVFEVNRILQELENRAVGLIEGASIEQVTLHRSVDMCYVGQGFEVTTTLASSRLNSGADVDQLRRSFDDIYEETYGRRLASMPARCVTWRVVASEQHGSVPLSMFEGGHSASLHRASKGTREVYFPESGPAVCGVYERSFLPPGASIRGPALLEEKTSTIVVPSEMQAAVDSNYNVVLTWVDESCTRSG